MPITTRPVQRIAGLQWFARSLPEGRQVLAGTMSLEIKEDTHLIIPLPVKPGTNADGIVFVELLQYLRVFDDLRECFLTENDFIAQRGDPFDGKVPDFFLEPGSYSPVFIPNTAELQKILPAPLTGILPDYVGYGFAVYSLKAGLGWLLPLVISYPAVNPDQLYYPTREALGTLPGKTAAQEATLYCQKLPHGRYSPFLWEESRGWAHPTVSSVLAKGLIHPKHHLQRLKLEPGRENADLVVV